MTDELGALVQRLVEDPTKLSAITPEQERDLLAVLRAVVGGVPAGPLPAPTVVTSAWSEADLLTVDEAAAQLRVSPRWLYRHAKTLPFARKLSRKVLRFSRSGITRWLATKRL
jgi:excisionase family DNA binding protein